MKLLLQFLFITIISFLHMNKIEGKSTTKQNVELNEVRNLLQDIIQNNPFSTLFGESQVPQPQPFNLAWVNAALAKCARIDPTLITAVFPSATNGLREPRMYYFENSTSNQLIWRDAQNWCSAKGMNLLTVYSSAENKVIQEKLISILKNVPVGAGGNTNRFWIGLNDYGVTAKFTYLGDSSSSFTDWHSGKPSGTANCVIYSQLVSTANIHMENFNCGSKEKFICEVSPECTALFMSRYPVQQQYENHRDFYLFPFKN